MSCIIIQSKNVAHKLENIAKYECRTVDQQIEWLLKNYCEGKYTEPYVTLDTSVAEGGWRTVTTATSNKSFADVDTHVDTVTGIAAKELSGKLHEFSTKRKYTKRKKYIKKNPTTGHGLGMRPNSPAHKIVTTLVSLHELKRSPDSMFTPMEVWEEMGRLGFHNITVETIGKRLSQLKNIRKLVHTVPSKYKKGTLLWGATPRGMKSIAAMGKAV
tara:strand:+ start:245 stop:889 length:645 start_codon:yes stop_codon:yes gene_type:complete